MNWKIEEKGRPTWDRIQFNAFITTKFYLQPTSFSITSLLFSELQCGLLPAITPRRLVDAKPSSPHE